MLAQVEVSPCEGESTVAAPLKSAETSHMVEAVVGGGVVVTGGVVVDWQRVFASEPQQAAPKACMAAATVWVLLYMVDSVLAQLTFVQRFPNLSTAPASTTRHVEPGDDNPNAPKSKLALKSDDTLHKFEPSWQRSLSTDPQHLAPICCSWRALNTLSFTEPSTRLMVEKKEEHGTSVHDEA